MVVVVDLEMTSGSLISP